MNALWVSRDEALTLVGSRIVEADIVLDIGPGIRPQDFVEPLVHICVEPHLPYVERLSERIKGDPRYILLNCTWQDALRVLPAKSVDTVFALDVIEHLAKAEGYSMLREAVRVARQQVVIFTPLGFFPQCYDDPSKPDRWGMDGAYWQTHRSGWEPDDFGDDWETVCCADFHVVDQNGEPLQRPFGAIWAIRNLSGPARSQTPIRSGIPAHYEKVVEVSLKRYLPQWAYTASRRIFAGFKWLKRRGQFAAKARRRVAATLGPRRQ